MPRDLIQDEIELGYVRPYRREYIHVLEHCNCQTRISLELAVLFAKNPTFASEAQCSNCEKLVPVGELMWADGFGETVGT